MLNIPISIRNRIFTQPKTLNFHSQKHSKHLVLSFTIQNSPHPTPMPPSSSSASKAKIVAEYAKSNRSACKKCSKTISNKALRLGLVTRDSRGYDVTKWHHLDCFSDSIQSTELIGGFDSLEGSDQEALKKKLVGVSKSSMEERTGEDGQETELEERNSKKAKRTGEGGNENELEKRNSKRPKRTDEDRQETELEERNSKKAELKAIEEAELNIVFSLSNVKDKYKDATLLPKWKAFQTIIFLERDDGLHDSNKIAAFDFDGCLAKTSVKRVGADAWSIMYPSIPDKLQGLYNGGYKLVIFTNESNIERWKNKRQAAVDSKIGRLNNFIKHVKVPIQVFIACGYSGKVEDPFRKPRPGMWQIMEKYFNSGISIDMDQLFSSFYVGDAAGRDNDHSDADIKFAEAIGLKFYVPEDYFCA